MNFTMEYQNGREPAASFDAVKTRYNAMLDSAFEYLTLHASEPQNGVTFVQAYLFTFDNRLRLLIGVQEETVVVYENLCYAEDVYAAMEAFYNGTFVPDMTKFAKVK